MADKADDAAHAATAAGELAAVTGQEEIAGPLFAFEFGYWLGKVLLNLWNAARGKAVGLAPIPRIAFPALAATTPAATAWNNLFIVMERWIDDSRAAQAAIGQLANLSAAAEASEHALQLQEVKTSVTRTIADRDELVYVIRNTAAAIAGTPFAAIAVTSQQVANSAAQVSASGALPAQEEALAMQLKVNAAEKAAILSAVKAANGATILGSISLPDILQATADGLAALDYGSQVPAAIVAQPAMSVAEAVGKLQFPANTSLVDSTGRLTSIGRQPMTIAQAAKQLGHGSPAALAAANPKVGVSLASLVPASGAAKALAAITPEAALAPESAGPIDVAGALAILLEAIAIASAKSGEQASNVGQPQALLSAAGALGNMPQPANEPDGYNANSMALGAAAQADAA